MQHQLECFLINLALRQQGRAGARRDARILGRRLRGPAVLVGIRPPGAFI